MCIVELTDSLLELIIIIFKSNDSNFSNNKDSEEMTLKYYFKNDYIIIYSYVLYYFTVNNICKYFYKLDMYIINFITNYKIVDYKNIVASHTFIIYQMIEYHI